MIRTNVAIRTSSPELVEFFYPRYLKTSNYSPFIDGGVIFDGDSKYLPMFRDAGIPYIYIKGTPEFDLTIPENLINFVYEKWDKTAPIKVVDYFKSYDKVNSELENIAKQVWVTGKCYLTDESEEQITKLYSLLARSAPYDLFTIFLSLSSNMDLDRLFGRIQWFLKSANKPSNISSARTKLTVESFNVSRGCNVEEALMGYLYSPTDNVELKLLKLLDALTKIRR